MVTGDNLLTAMTVARECRILDRNKKIYILKIAENQYRTPIFTLQLVYIFVDNHLIIIIRQPDQ
jgi:magnesium-transporting ATPase (P-type)